MIANVARLLPVAVLLASCVAAPPPPPPQFAPPPPTVSYYPAPPPTEFAGPVYHRLRIHRHRAIRPVVVHHRLHRPNRVTKAPAQ